MEATKPGFVGSIDDCPDSQLANVAMPYAEVDLPERNSRACVEARGVRPAMEGARIVRTHVTELRTLGRRGSYPSDTKPESIWEVFWRGCKRRARWL